jgi:hypothetical protein
MSQINPVKTTWSQVTQRKNRLDVRGDIRNENFPESGCCRKLNQPEMKKYNAKESPTFIFRLTEKRISPKLSGGVEYPGASSFRPVLSVNNRSEHFSREDCLLSSNPSAPDLCPTAAIHMTSPEIQNGVLVRPALCSEERKWAFSNLTLPALRAIIQQLDMESAE